MKKILDCTLISDDLYENLILSYKEMLTALKFIEEVFPDVFIALSIDPYGLLNDAREVLKTLTK